MSFKEQLMSYLNITDADFLVLTRVLKKDDLPSPSLFSDMEKALARIKKAVENKERIIIYGDYDCDGVMATSILVKAFSLIGYPVSFYLPSRYLDGYGLNEKKVTEIADKGYQLIITVDNGVSAVEAIEKAVSLGIDVIVTDHHEALKELPKCYALLHPVIADAEPTYSCGAYVAFMLSIALLRRIDDYLLSLAGIATVSDMMPLTGVNRDLVRLAITTLNTNAYLPISLLANNQEIDENTIGMLLAPKINAVGRLVENTNVNRLVKFFVSDDKAEIDALATWISNINENRKALMKMAVSNHDSAAIGDAPAIVLLTTEKEGLLGLLANRLLQEYRKPVVVFTADSNDDGILKGSARSQPGFNIAKAFLSLNHLLLKSGGHGLAGGLSIKREDFAAFKKEFEDLARKYPLDDVKDEGLEIAISDVNWDNYAIIRQLAPFGQQFSAPQFVIKNVDTQKLGFISMGHHLSTPITKDTRLLGFNISQTAVTPLKSVNLFGDMQINVFKNQRSLIYKITGFQKAE